MVPKLSDERSEQERRRDYHRRYYLENRDRLLEKARRRDRRNPDLIRPPAKTPEERRSRNRAHHHANREKRLEQKRTWYAANKELCNASSAARRAVARRATPAWANRFFIEEAYRLARLRTEITGIPWEVDHIVPLISDLVCGLHVEHNLRVIPRALNRSKGNRQWPDQP